MIGRYRPIEQDALRILTLVHQLGERPAARSPAETRWFIDTESQLQHLDHLIRHPIDLAYVVIDQVRSRGPELETDRRELPGRLRLLLGAPQGGRYRPHLLRPFDPGAWQRWDDVLAFLGCRGMLRVEPMSAESRPSAGDSRQEEGLGQRALPQAEVFGADLRYRLTAEGVRWLEPSVYPAHASSAAWRERCDLLRAVLPAHLLQPPSQPALAAYLGEIEQRLDTYLRDEQIRPEDDPLGRLFQTTFREPL